VRVRDLDEKETEDQKTLKEKHEKEMLAIKDQYTAARKAAELETDEERSKLAQKHDGFRREFLEDTGGGELPPWIVEKFAREEEELNDRIKPRYDKLNKDRLESEATEADRDRKATTDSRTKWERERVNAKENYEREFAERKKSQNHEIEDASGAAARVRAEHDDKITKLQEDHALEVREMQARWLALWE
jgi:transcription-repair coupling factor (superfamily II helicase)